MPDQAVADFTLPATGGTFSLTAARGNSLALYFYPKDNTPGCTMESQQFSSTFVLDRHSVCAANGAASRPTATPRQPSRL